MTKIIKKLCFYDHLNFQTIQSYPHSYITKLTLYSSDVFISFIQTKDRHSKFQHKTIFIKSELIRQKKCESYIRKSSTYFPILMCKAYE